MRRRHKRAAAPLKPIMQMTVRCRMRERRAIDVYPNGKQYWEWYEPLRDVEYAVLVPEPCQA
jgi:hypothetical protein